jgi:tRNA A37 methylthiotransferase MiaB
LTGVDGIERVRVSYLQPAETRPGLVEVIAGTPGVAPYFDLSFQHASEPVLRRMRRFGSVEAFLELCGRIRSLAPDAGIRSNVIVGFPGETEADVAELERFLTEARLDAVGVFGYSDEDGTEAAGYPDKVPAAVVSERVARVSSLVDELVSQRAEDRVGARVSVLVDELGFTDGEDGEAVGLGRAAHQAPESDGDCVLTGRGWVVGELVDAEVLDSEGVDLVVAAVRQP